MAIKLSPEDIRQVQGNLANPAKTMGGWRGCWRKIRASEPEMAQISRGNREFLDKTIHDRTGFEYGEPNLDEYLERKACQDHRRGLCRVYVRSGEVDGGDAAQLAALGAFVGHCYPVWLRFRGGKGVATYFGIWLALAPVTFLALSTTWLIVAWIVRISSVSALATATTAPFWDWFIGPPGGATVALAALVGALVFLRHRHNITRLRIGAEPRIGNRPLENR